MYRWIVSVSATTPSSIASTIARIDASGVRRSCEIAAKRWRRASSISRRAVHLLQALRHDVEVAGQSRQLCPGRPVHPDAGPTAGDLSGGGGDRGRPGHLLGGERGERDGDDGREGEQQAQQPRSCGEMNISQAVTVMLAKAMASTTRWASIRRGRTPPRPKRGATAMRA